MKTYLTLSLILLGPILGLAQSVQVTALLDTNTVRVGEMTTLRVFAQVDPGLQANADRIFSWYLDVLNTNGVVGLAGYDSLVKAASDNDPLISGLGFNDGSHRRGIYDTFLNLPGAGVMNPVELISIPVTGGAVGLTRFEVRAGSGVSGLSEDFIVATMGGGDPMTGGDYTLANADLEVVPGMDCSLTLEIARVNGGGPGEALNLTFVPCAGFDHEVQFTDDLLVTNSVWQALPGAPHNAGTVMDTNNVANRYYRVVATQP